MANEKVRTNADTKKLNGWSFENYFKSIKRFKWWIIGSTIIGAIVGFVTFRFIVNPSQKSLSASFSCELAGTAKTNGTYKLVDGTVFDCNNLISEENLAAVRLGDLKTYEKINVKKLYANNAITIEKIYDETKERVVSFKISSKARNYPSDDIGKQFLSDVINSATTTSSKAIDNFKLESYFDNNTATEAFEKQIGLLQNQYSSIDSLYSNIKSGFGKNVVINSSGDTLQNVYNKFTSKYYNGTTNNSDLLYGEMYSNYYVNYSEGKEAEKISEIKMLSESYLASIKSHETSYKAYSKQLEELKGANLINTSDTEFAKKFVELNEHVVNYSLTINRLEKQLNLYGYYRIGDTSEFEYKADDSVIKRLEDKNASWVKGNKDFKQKIASEIATLTTEKESAVNVYKYVLRTYSNKVTLLNNSYVVLTNSTSNLVGLAIGLVGGFAASSIAVATIYAYSKKKEE